MMHKKMTSMLGLLAMMSVGCGEAAEQEAQPTTGGDLCTQSAAHVSSCLGQQIAADPGCNVQDAQALLDQSCDDLSRQTSGGKGDLMCNPLFFWTDCNKGIKLYSVMCQEEGICDWSDGFSAWDTCFMFQIKDSQGNVVVADTTAGAGHLMTEDLDDGEYTIEVLNRDGSIVELMKDPNTLSGVDFSNDMDATFIVEGGRSDSHTLYLPMLAERGGDIHQCGSLSSNIQLSCDGEEVSDPVAEWDWYVTATPVSAGGWLEGSGTQAFTLNGLNLSTSSNYMYPGTYELNFYYIPHDGSEFNQYSSMFSDDGDDFRNFARKSGYENGYKETRTIELTAEDFTSQFAIARQDLEISYPAGSCPR
jgi:hypothetical protein